MKYRWSLFLIISLWCCSALKAQEKKCFKVMWYNVENFFDVVDDSLRNDSEFLPGGIRGWSYNKYQTKQAQIAKVITALGGWDTPALVGMCEVESRKCLIDLTRYSGLKNLHYKYLHYESPDPRGIDVALLYQPAMFQPISSEAIRIKYPSGGNTRDILLASGCIPGGDTLHVFVCHFPSRLGGEKESESRRVFVASVLRQKVDSLFAIQPKANILIMGDFNDFPSNSSLSQTLKAMDLDKNKIAEKSLYNMMFPLMADGKGTNKFQGNWGILDQIIVSSGLLTESAKLRTRALDAHIFSPDFLLETDVKYLGKQPFRTYVGMKYHEGFSDHLPVYIDLWY